MFVSTSIDLEDSKSSNTAGSSKPETSKIGVVDAGSSGSIMGSTDSEFKGSCVLSVYVRYLRYVQIVNY